MATLTLNVPDSIAKLYPKVGDKLFLSALRESIRRLINAEKRNLKTIQKRIDVFERKYKSTFQDYQKVLPLTGDYQIHEDYGEWSYLVDVAHSIENDIVAYQNLNGNI